jgi:hypothetical protein
MQGETPAALACALNTQKEFFSQVAWLLLAPAHVRACRNEVMTAAAAHVSCLAAHDMPGCMLLVGYRQTIRF